MYYLRARYYNSKNGRFQTRDGFEGRQVRQLSECVGFTIYSCRVLLNEWRPSAHAFAYADGDPVSRIDPSGNTAADEGAAYQPTITFSRQLIGHGERHLFGTSLSGPEVEAAIRASIEQTIASGQFGGSFYGWLEIQGVSLQFRVFVVAAYWLNVGTYVQAPLLGN